AVHVNASSDLLIGKISATGDVSLGAAGSILDADADAANDIEASALTLVANNGSIGAVDNPLEINAAAAVNVTAESGVYLVDSDDLLAGSIVAHHGDVDLRAGRSLLDGRDGDASNVGGNLIHLQAGPSGSIGTTTNRLQVAAIQQASAQAGGNVYLGSNSGPL